MQYHSSEVFLHPLHIGFAGYRVVDYGERVVYPNHAVGALLDIQGSLPRLVDVFGWEFG